MLSSLQTACPNLVVPTSKGQAGFEVVNCP